MPIGAWWFRVLFAALAVVTSGVFAALYLLLWWLLPQASPVSRRRGGAWRLLLVIVLTAGALAAWGAHLGGGLRGPSGEPLLWPGILLALAAAFFLRQVRG